MERLTRTRFVNSLSGFKSANLLGTADREGLANLALISSVFHVGADPALLGMLMRPPVVARHSLENLQDSGEYSLNAVSASIHAAAHQCSAKYAREESEFEATGLTPRHGGLSRAPYVAESPLQIGLSLVESVELVNGTVLVIGAVEEVYLSDAAAVADDGYVDIESLGVVAISALDGYHETRALGRRAFARPNTDGG